MDIIALIAGFVLLAVGGDLLVRGAVRVAAHLGIPTLLIGLTLVGFGTSAPEFVTSLQGALAGSPGIAIGNVVGSNIANILLILGVVALVNPVRVEGLALRRDAMVMLSSAVLFAIFSAIMPLERITGIIFIGLLFAYLAACVAREWRGGPLFGAASARSTARTAAEPDLLPQKTDNTPIPVAAGMVVAGLLLLVFGGQFLVSGAVGIARGFGISETLIGLTIVAVGTSAPEMATSVVAALRRETGVAFGNVVGSNIFNTLGVAGLTVTIAPLSVPPEIVTFDNIVMLVASVALVIFAATGRRVGRREGGVLVLGYAAYLGWLAFQQLMPAAM